MKNFYVVATPIGNLDDISFRAIKILKEVDYICCENMDKSKILLGKYDINKKLILINKYNEKEKSNFILSKLSENSIAIISDAGTPLISDPGQYLVNFLKRNNVNVISIPGASSILTGLTSSGLTFSSFGFLGFFDKKKTKKIKAIISNLNLDVIIFFESPKRIQKTLHEIKEYFGNVKLVVARELSKKYETIIHDYIENIEKLDLKGEIVLYLPTRHLLIMEDEATINFIKKLLKLGLSEKYVIETLSKLPKLSKNYLYNLVKEL